MQPDLSQVILHSNYPAFKNNREYDWFFTISGVTAGGLNQQTTTVNLDEAPDLIDITFNGPTDTVFSTDPRPGDAWFKQGAVWVRGDNPGAGYTNYPTPWVIYSSITGTQLTITVQYVQQFTAALTLTSTLAYYKLVDYSVF